MIKQFAFSNICNYWKDSCTEMKSVQTLTLSALLIALRVAMTSFFITIPYGATTTRVYCTFLVVALGCLIYGPVVGFWSGAVADTIGFLLFPSGAYFFGYCITAMLSGLIYGLFLYKQRITIARLLLCKLTINILCNMLINGLWDSMLMGSHYWTLVISRAPKNIILLPLEVALMFLLFRMLLPILAKKELVNTIQDNGKISLF